MDLIIYDLLSNKVEELVTPDMDLYARIIRKEKPFDKTVDMQITVQTVAIDNNHLIIEFPNSAVNAFNLSNCHYHKVEVL